MCGTAHLEPVCHPEDEAERGTFMRLAWKTHLAALRLTAKRRCPGLFMLASGILIQ